MTDEQISLLGPAFAANLGGFRLCFAADAKAGHFDTFCRGLLSDLPRKLEEPIALSNGTNDLPHTAAIIRYHQRCNAAATVAHKKRRHYFEL